VAYFSVLAGDLEFAAEVWDELTEEDPRNTAPTAASNFLS
jgi:hypothetical protein